MRIDVYRSASATASALADTLTTAITRKPALVLGLPAGRTPIRLYRALIERHRAGRLNLRRVTAFNVDEFAGLPPGHPASYTTFMRRHLFQHVSLDPRRIHIPNGCASDLNAEARRFDAVIEDAGGLDIVVLGIGENGHLAFNEPGATLRAESHVAMLKPVTRRANAALFGDDWRRVPREGITMGMGTLLGARQVVLLAAGAAKARIVARALEGPITTRVPASLLQLHPNAIVVLDREAASGLRIRQT